ncbi:MULTISPECIES: S24 family peptidase [Deinococcus]|uniref:S24 family peptidase n=1 Tax=Deinococcus rhizophilus TaxID=3049544 RepID=A0ABT7JC43_9DEIO|nr:MULTISPECIES: S24 family peptidase [Deinococcus]MDL2342606.1 S24 family peptidase [Deinococcus rhizophilus]
MEVSLVQSYFLPKRYAPSKAPVLGLISAGTPLDPSPFSVRRRMPIPPGFRRFGMFVLQVDGDSMTLADGTGITHGSFVLVDRKDLLTDQGHTFAFQLPDGTMVVKRLRLFQGRPAMYSDNAAYPPVQIDPSIRNCGRVYAVSQDGRRWELTRYRGWGGTS